MSSITPPPTGGGNAKYIVVVILLLGGIAGLLIWRSSGSSPEGPVVIHAPDASGPAVMPPRIEDEVPPPPEIPDAGPDTGPTRVGTTGAPANCSATKCSGAATPDLEAALTMRARQARRCYEQALESDSTLKGHVSISVRVASNGQVCSAGVASNDMGNAAVATCAANKFRQAGIFPAPRGGCVDLAVPIVFVPGGK
jgi:hypothetical protein